MEKKGAVKGIREATNRPFNNASTFLSGQNRNTFRSVHLYGYKPSEKNNTIINNNQIIAPDRTPAPAETEIAYSDKGAHFIEQVRACPRCMEREIQVEARS